MNLKRFFFSLLLVGSIAASVTAQNVRRPAQRNAGPATSANPLTALEQDLENAIKQMTSALPIYGVYRPNAIEDAYQALLVVDDAAFGADNAPPRSAPIVSSAASKKAYSKGQIATSQAAMQAAIRFLLHGEKELAVAAGSTPNEHAQATNRYISEAVKQAKVAVSMFGK